MTVSYLTPELRSKDAFHHIDMGFLNRRLAMTALPPPIREAYTERARPAGRDSLPPVTKCGVGSSVQNFS
jgi:hypothetical protein